MNKEQKRKGVTSGSQSLSKPFSVLGFDAQVLLGGDTPIDPSATGRLPGLQWQQPPKLPGSEHDLHTRAFDPNVFFDSTTPRLHHAHGLLCFAQVRS